MLYLRLIDEFTLQHVMVVDVKELEHRLMDDGSLKKEVQS